MNKQELDILEKTLEKLKIKNSVYSEVAKLAISKATNLLASDYTEYTEAWLDIAEFCRTRLTESPDLLEDKLDTFWCEEEAK